MKIFRQFVSLFCISTIRGTAPCNQEPLLRGRDEHTNMLSMNKARGIAYTQRISQQQMVAWKGFLRKLEVEDHNDGNRNTSAASLPIIAIGGSMAAGIDCKDENLGTTGKQCSYSARFSGYLQKSYKNIIYHNRALGGTTTGSVLPQLNFVLTGHASNDPAAVAPALVIIDFSVNDRWEEQDWAEPKRSKRETNISADVLSNKESKVFAATEILLRHVLLRYPMTSILLVEGFCEPTSFSMRAHQKAALIYVSKSLIQISRISPSFLTEFTFVLFFREFLFSLIHVFSRMAAVALHVGGVLVETSLIQRLQCTSA